MTDSQSFYTVLKEHFPRNEVLLPEKPRILNIGCGLSEESEPLRDFFPGCCIIGVDNGENVTDGKLVQVAKRRGNVDEAHFCDASQLIGNGYDVYVTRHPNVRMLERYDYVTEDVYKRWKGIFRGLRRTLRQNNCLVITTTEKPEMNIVEGLLGRQNLRLWGPYKNGGFLLSHGSDLYVYFASGK